MSSRPSEKLFEEYLNQEGIVFEYEPQYLQPTHPDYKFEINGTKYLVEIEDIDESPGQADLVEHLLRGGSVSYQIDRSKLHKQMRRKIDSGAEQLKPHAGDFDQMFIVLVHNSPLIHVDGDNLFAAINGDEYINITLNPEPTGGINKVEKEHRVNGVFRYNDPETGEMKTRHRFISAVGLIERHFEGTESKLFLNLISNSLGDKRLRVEPLNGHRAKTFIPPVVVKNI